MQVIYSALLIIYLTFSLFVGYEFFSAYPIPELLIKILEIFFLPFFILICILTGRVFTLRYEKIFNDNSENYLFSFGLGSGFLSLLMLLLGAGGFFVNYIIWILTLVLLASERKEILSLVKYLNNIKDSFGKVTLKEIFLLIPVFISILLILLISLAPPTYYDTLSYHYSLPGLYTIAKKIAALPFNFYSHFPQNSEMLYTFAMLLGNEVTPNFVTFSFSLFTLFGIYLLSKRIFSANIGKTSAVFLSTTTAFLLLSTGGYVESGLAFYTLLALYSFIIYTETEKNAAILLTGLFSGLALGTKYTGGITFISILILTIFFIPRKKIFVCLFTFCLSAFVIFLPWMIKNFINTGNPVFPFLYQHLGSTNMPFNYDLARNYFSMLQEYSTARNVLEAMIKIITLPFGMIYSPQDYGGGFDMLGDFGWIFLLICAPSVFFVREKFSTPAKILILFAFIFFIQWILMKPILRFLYPVLPLTAMICSYSINAHWQKKGLLKYLLLAGAVLFSISNYYLFFSIEKFIEPFGVAIGTEGRKTYLVRKLLYSPYPAFEFINSQLPQDSKILFIGERRGYYCRRNYITLEVFSAGQNPVVVWANSSKNLTIFKEKLSKYGITHVLYNADEGRRLSGYGIFNFSKNGQKIFFEFLTKTSVIFNQNNVFIYKN